MWFVLDLLRVFIVIYLTRHPFLWLYISYIFMIFLVIVLVVLFLVTRNDALWNLDKLNAG